VEYGRYIIRRFSPPKTTGHGQPHHHPSTPSGSVTTTTIFHLSFPALAPFQPTGTYDPATFKSYFGCFCPLFASVIPNSNSNILQPALYLSLAPSHTQTHTHITYSIHTHTYSHTHSHTLTHTHTHTDITYTRTHTHIHTHTHTPTHRPSPPQCTLTHRQTPNA
jgi:hypothetical protein